MNKKLVNQIKRNGGFSLIELVIVVTILAVIAVIGFQTIGTGAIAKSRAQADISNAALLAKSIESAIQEDKLANVDMADVNVHTATTNVYRVLTGALDQNTTDSDGDKPKVYVQKIPKPQRQQGDFTVTYTAATGKIIITNGAAATGTQLFPKLEDYTSDTHGYNVLGKEN